MAPAPLRSVLVVGAGLIGTSIGLALTRRGVEVWLEDADPAKVRLAVELGAGRAADSRAPWGDRGTEQPGGVAGSGAGRAVEHAVLAVPPRQTAAALRRVQQAGLAASASDVASVKAGPLTEARALGCDLSAFAGGHPVAGRERAGPAAARPDLFAGRPWVLTPTAETTGAALDAARSVAELCGGVPVIVPPAAHDEAMALVSHAPQFAASALAGLLADAAPDTVALAGQGLRDATRIAASDPRLWTEIATANAEPVADVLDQLARRLAAVAAALRDGDAAPVDALLRRGNVGHARLPGKHSRPAATYAVVPVVVPDEPGRLARLLADAAMAGVNVEDLHVEHAPGAPLGVIELAVEPAAAGGLAAALTDRGWSVHPVEAR